MKRVLLILFPALLILFTGCDKGYYKEPVLIKEINMLKGPFAANNLFPNIDTNNYVETKTIIRCELSSVKIVAQTLQSDSFKIIKKMSFYQFGSKGITISKIEVTNPINLGTVEKPIMGSSGIIQFKLSSGHFDSEEFYIDGTGSFDQISLGDIVQRIENNRSYSIAKKYPNKETVSTAMRFIMNESGLNDFFKSLDDPTLNILNSYIRRLNAIESNNDENRYQNLGSKLNQEFIALVKSGWIGPELKPLEVLTKLIKALTDQMVPKI